MGATVLRSCRGIPPPRNPGQRVSRQPSAQRGRSSFHGTRNCSWGLYNPASSESSCLRLYGPGRDTSITQTLAWPVRNGRHPRARGCGMALASLSPRHPWTRGRRQRVAALFAATPPRRHRSLRGSLQPHARYCGRPHRVTPKASVADSRLSAFHLSIAKIAKPSACATTSSLFKPWSVSCLVRPEHDALGPARRRIAVIGVTDFYPASRPRSHEVARRPRHAGVIGRPISASVPRPSSLPPGDLAGLAASGADHP